VSGDASPGWWRFGGPVLGLAVFGLYAPTFGFDFVDLDDHTTLVNNAHAHSGLTLSSLWWALTNFHSGWWYPVTWLTHFATVSVFGMWPGGHHLVNALFHAANAALAVAVLRRFKASPAQALAIAAFSFLHPTRVESVAWVTERKDLVFVFFGLVTLLAWARYRERPSPSRMALVLAAYSASLMGKSTLVTLPLLLLLLDAWTLRLTRTTWKAQLLEKLPLLVLAALSSAVTLAAVRSAAGLQSLNALPFSERLLSIPVALVRYLGLTFVPLELCAYYPRAPIPPWQSVVSGAALVALAALLFALRRRLPHLALGFLWFALALAPTLGLAQAGGQFIADRYLYWPHLGLFAGLVLSVPTGLATRAAGRVTACAVAAVLALLTTFQLPMWRDSETLFRSTLELEPQNPFIQASLGLWLLKQNRPGEALEPLAKSAPAYPFGQSLYGLAQIEVGSFQDGLKSLDEASRRAPHDEGIARNVALGKERLEYLQRR
jgi:protein O-mannosyl-transferase